MAIEFKKATKQQAKLRAALFGPSGSGKTFSALRIAIGMGGRIAVIDTERGSASKYADRFEFDVLDLTRKDIPSYQEAINAAGLAGYEVLIIDSLSHAWQELLQEVDKLAKSKFRGNTWSAWSEGTPKQRMLVDAILDFPGHVIATMRSKTEWAQENTDNGKTKPVRVGLAPEQGKGIEYEFDLLLELSTDHIVNVIKDRTGKFQDRLIEKPGEDFGEELAAWLSDGAPPPDPWADERQARLRVYEAMTGRGFTKSRMEEVSLAWLAGINAPNFASTTPEQRKEFARVIAAGDWDEGSGASHEDQQAGDSMFTAGTAKAKGAA